jgi:hypothetical protein
MNAGRVQLDPKRAAVIAIDMINEPANRAAKWSCRPLCAGAASARRIDAARKYGAGHLAHDSHRRNTRRDREW